MLETARIQNQNACIAEDRINEKSDGFNHPGRRSLVGATTNLNFSRTSYNTPGATSTLHHRENHSQLPPYLSAYTMIEVEGQGDCLPLSVAYHIYSSTSADAGVRVRDEVTQFMLDNFQLYGSTLARDKNELIENVSRVNGLVKSFSMLLLLSTTLSSPYIGMTSTIPQDRFSIPRTRSIMIPA